MNCFILLVFLYVEPKHFSLLLEKTSHLCSKFSLSCAVLLNWLTHPISYLISSENNLLDLPRNLFFCILSSKILVQKSLYLIKWSANRLFFFVIELRRYLFALKSSRIVLYLFFSILFVHVIVFRHNHIASNHSRSY